MKLLTEDELTRSAVVANINMNRVRNAVGVNSYEKDIKLNPATYLTAHIKKFGKAEWLDLCCGEGRALIQTAMALDAQQLQDKATITGIDLVDYFADIPSNISCIDFLVHPLEAWVPSQKYDLITCVHGLHYIGDKLSTIQKCLQNIGANGYFTANFDINSISINAKNASKFIQSVFKMNSIYYNPRTHIVQCNGPRGIDFGVEYLGANDKVGPNYTGQEAVNAYYALKDDKF